MLDALPHIQLHLLDPLPAHVVAQITEGLQSRGHYAVVRCAGRAVHGNPIPVEPLLDGFEARCAGPHVLLTSRRLGSAGGAELLGHANPERDLAVVTLPMEPGESRFDPVVAARTLKLVLHQLGRIEGQSACRATLCIHSNADTPGALDAQESWPCTACEAETPARSWNSTQPA